jgi:hypothetical protein
MNLLTLGDSFTYGEELSDRNTAWPIRLANRIGYDVINLGLPGNSNPAMCRQLIQHLSFGGEPTPDLVIIGWTSPGRTEHSDAVGNYNLWPGYSGNLFIKNESWRKELLEYINKYHNDEYLFEQFIQQIIYVQNLLENKGIQYLMLTTVGNEYYKNIYYSKFKYYEEQMDLTHLIGWPTEGMAEWTAGCTRGPNGHFLEDGHLKVVDKLDEYIRNLGWFS